MSQFNTDALKGYIKRYNGKGKLVGLSLREYLDQKADCGCGQNCCDNTLHFIDHDTGEHYVEYYKSGVKVVETYAVYTA